MHQVRIAKGFTLIEVMVVVAIVAILASIAYPSYREQVARSRRADAKAQLLDRAQWMERQYSVAGAYPTTLPTAQAFTGTTASMYTASIASGSTTSAFTLEATPVTTGTMANDRCGTFRVTNTGTTTVSASGLDVECWQK